jgi:hypothetical protein
VDGSPTVVLDARFTLAPVLDKGIGSLLRSCLLTFYTLSDASDVVQALLRML